MSGHSKWATTKRHKAAVDAKRGKRFSLIGKELSIAARDGGGDPAFNPRLRTLIAKAKQANMPAANITRAIDKGTGKIEGVTYENLTYEGYGPAGIGFIIEVTTDNKNRSASEIRSTFSKFSGRLAGSHSLAFNFERLGQFLIAKEKMSEEALLDLLLEVEVEDYKVYNDHFEILCPIGKFDTLNQAFEAADIEPDSAELAYIPLNTIPVTNTETARKILRLFDALDDLDDVRNVFSNFDIDESIRDKSL